ncbi:MAG: hypothetical protein JKY11_02580 [Alphaproteobacteria bacterium]|nr:hypothetical protein [Alphaproteobacteria bacterium]
MGLSDNMQESFNHEEMDNDVEKEELLKAYFSISDPVKRRWHLKHLKQDSISE